MTKPNASVCPEVDDRSEDDVEDSGSDDGNQDNNTQTLLAKSKKRISECNDADEIRKKKCKRESDLFKQPTVEELNQLRETETLFHSNLFRLQIEEVLGSIVVKEKYRKLFEKWFLRFKEKIESIDESDEFSLATAKSLVAADTIVPQPLLSNDAKGVFKFSKPSNISIIGSYSLGCITGPEIKIDVMVEMPSKLFQKLDYQNYRYMKKRALYLALIASNVDEELAESKKFIGDIWMPKLKIVPNGRLGKKVTVHVHLAAEESSFKLNRFLPDKNSVRSGWYFSEDTKLDKSDSLMSTPHYNSIILHDLTMSRANKYNTEIIKELPNLRDGIILLKIWLRQRQLNNGHASFSNHIITMYVLALLAEKKLNTFMSSYQIVRNVWNNLALSDWNKKGLTMCLDDNSEESRVMEYHKYYDCVFLDTSGYNNLAAHMSADTYQWTRCEAERALKCLDNPNIDSFQTLFMRPVPFHLTFDNLLCFNDGSIFEKIVDDNSSLGDQLNYGPNKRVQAIKIICEVMREGLGKRVSNMFVQLEQEKEWDVTEKPPSDGIGKIIIGFSLDPDFCFNIIDKGPHANLPEAAAFRKFWGNKSELRRFQDGSISEALVWLKDKKRTLADKRTVCKRIVRFLLKEKFDLSKDRYEYVAEEIDEYLQLKKIRVPKLVYGTGEEATLQVLQVFTNLEKELTSLTDLPLSISGVEGFSPVVRYTDVFPPLPMTNPPEDVVDTIGEYAMLDESSVKKLPRYVPRIDACLQLSMSGKWPNELEAVRKMKAAFHIQIAECLRKQYSVNAQANLGWVDVFKEGFVFRLEVAHRKEIVLLKRQVSEDRVEKYRDNDESVQLEKRLFHLPKLSGALHGLHSQQPSFGPTCCLAKRWLSAHLLDDSHIPDIVVELLIASMYLAPDPYKPAQTPQTAFLRFLEFFARHHWTTEPILVNFNNEMTREEIVVVENSFRTSRDAHPPISICTPYDHDQSIWSREAPTRLILNRIGSLAKAALKLADEQLNSHSSNISFRPLFMAPTTEYDLLIRLKSSLNPRRAQFHDLPENYPTLNWHCYNADSKGKIPVIEFDPVQCYLRELRRGYDQIALFFHDTYGGSIIGVLLKPAALESKEFKISNLNCRKLNSEGKLVLDVGAMIDDFSILGRGLVKSIDTRSILPCASN